MWSFHINVTKMSEARSVQDEQLSVFHTPTQTSWRGSRLHSVTVRMMDLMIFSSVLITKAAGATSGWYHLSLSLVGIIFRCHWLAVYSYLVQRPQAFRWGTKDAEIKVPSVENLELKGSPFKALSRSEYSHACFTYCQGFLPWTIFYSPGPFISRFSKTSPEFFLC